VGPGFENVGVWSTAVDHAVGSGTPEFEGATCTTRGCDLNAKGFNSIVETLTEYDQESMQLAFDIVEGLPGFVLSARSHWQVVALTDSTSTMNVTSTVQMKPFLGSLMGGAFKRNANRIIPTILEDLKVYAETGDVSESKRKRMEVLAKK
ncbi:MAG: SRPBCC family protein, partial [Bacteroidia bacterium]|nr:SRPBCC family protein [Bacteroidia bacterium]